MVDLSKGWPAVRVVTIRVPGEAHPIVRLHLGPLVLLFPTTTFLTLAVYLAEAANQRRDFINEVCPAGGVWTRDLPPPA
jgi:hypothetical protein